METKIGINQSVINEKKGAYLHYVNIANDLGIRNACHQKCKKHDIGTKTVGKTTFFLSARTKTAQVSKRRWKKEITKNSFVFNL